MELTAPQLQNVQYCYTYVHRFYELKPVKVVTRSHTTVSNPRLQLIHHCSLPHPSNSCF